MTTTTPPSDCTVCPHLAGQHDPIVGCIARGCDCHQGPRRREGLTVRIARLLAARRAPARAGTS